MIWVRNLAVRNGVECLVAFGRQSKAPVLALGSVAGPRIGYQDCEAAFRGSLFKTKWETIQEEHVHHLSSKIRGGLAAVALVAALAGGFARPARAQAAAPAPNAPAQKTVKDQGEYDIYNDVTKDMLAKNFAKMITDLDAWKQKYPTSDFKDDRSALYIQAYAGSGQWAKVLDEAGPLLSKDLKTVLNDPKTGPADQMRALYTATTAIAQVPNPTADEFAIATKAAQQLMDYDTKPAGASDADWAAARAQLQAAAKGALLYMAMKPGADAKQKKDWAAAEAAFKTALTQYPDSSQVAYELGGSELAQQASNPAKISLGLYEIARAVSIDPAIPPLPTDVVASLGSDTLLGQKFIALSAGTPGIGTLANGAVIEGHPAYGIEELAQAAGPMLDNAKNLLDHANSVLANVDKMLIKVDGDLGETMPKISDLADSLQGVSKDATALISRATKLITDNEGDLKKDLVALQTVVSDLQGVLKNADGMLGRTDKQIVEQMKALHVVLLNLKVATTYSKALTQDLGEKPNRLIFSGKPNKLTPESAILNSEQPLPAKVQ